MSGKSNCSTGNMAMHIQKKHSNAILLDELQPNGEPFVSALIVKII
jgi:hypothetical protein